MRRASFAAVLTLLLLSPASQVCAEELKWGLAENEQEGLKLGLSDDLIFSGVYANCKPPAREVGLMLDVKDEQASIIKAIASRGNTLHVNVTSGSATLSKSAVAEENDAFGAAWFLILTAPIDHKLFGELARTGSLQFKGDGGKTPGADAISASYKSAQGKEDIRTFVRRCKQAVS